MVDWLCSFQVSWKTIVFSCKFPWPPLGPHWALPWQVVNERHAVVADVYYERLGLPGWMWMGFFPTVDGKKSPRISPIMDFHASENMDFWYVHVTCMYYIINISLFHYFILDNTISQQVVAFPLPGMQEITAHGSIVRRDQSDAQNRINVWESRAV